LCAVAAAGVEIEIVGVVVSAPDNHLAASPHRSVNLSGKGCVCNTSGYPTVGTTIVPAPVVKVHAGVAEDATPDDHFAAGPYRCVRVSRRGGVGCAGSRPTIASRIVSAASVAIVKRGVDAAPDDHFAAGPYCGVSSTAEYIIRDAGSRPTVRVRIVSAARVQIDRLISSTPHHHFAARPDRSMVPSRFRRIDRAGSCPSVCAGIVSPACIQVAVKTTSNSTPDDHLGAGPDCGVLDSSYGRVGRSSSCPSVVGWVVPTPSVEKVRVIPSTPNNHFTTSPYSRVCISGNGRVDGARGGPSVGRWVISTASVEVVPAIASEGSPPSFRCRSRLRCGGRARRARSQY
jgi:hypothetical protein